MSLQQQISDDLRTAMKARDRATTGALRMAIASLKNRAIADGLGPQGALDDETVMAVLGAEVKRRREAAAAFREAGRDESADAEEAEAEVYARYLPAPLSDDELATLVDEAVAREGAQSMRDMGAVMKVVLAQVQGRADGGRVSALVKQRLA